MNKYNISLCLCFSFLFIIPACDNSSKKRSIDPGLTPSDLVLALPTVEEPQLPDGIRIKAMSYNVYGGNFATAEEIGSMLAEQDADLIGLQECPEEMVAPMAQAAGMAHFAGSGTALLSRTPLSEVAQVPLTTGRGYLHALTQIEETQFSVYVAHLGWNVDGNKQCREFADEHLSLDPIDHLVLMGDFNDEHLSPQIAFLEVVVGDAFSALGWYPGQRISWPSTGFDDTEGSQLIDLIFFRRDFAPIVIRGDVLNLSPVLSDHKPVLAELLYPRSEPFAADPYVSRRDPQAGWPQPLPPNLLSNPGAEDGLTGWQSKGAPQATGERDNQQAFGGQFMFSGYEERPDEQTRASSGSQQVTLDVQAKLVDDGLCTLYATGQMTTGYQVLTEGEWLSNMARPYDQGELVVEVLDEEGLVLDRTSSGQRDTLAWFPVAMDLPVPPKARSARLIWISHHKILNGSSNDALFDDLYLGLQCGETGHPWLSGNLLKQPGAEDESLDHWASQGWTRRADLEIFGLAVFPPWSYSGHGYFFAGGELDLEPGPAGTSRLSQTVDLSPYFAQIDKGSMAVRWGGRVRTWEAQTGVRLALEIIDENGVVWGTLDGREIRAAEWTAAEMRTLLPPGTGGLRLVLETEVEPMGTGAFADELFVRLEQIP